MSKKNKNKIKIDFLGANAYQVTGSMTLIEYNHHKILLECGLVQTNKVVQDFKDNAQNFDFKASELDYIFVGHPHIDHIGRIPKLFKDGATCPVICGFDAVDLFEPLLHDSAHIISKDAEIIMRRTKKSTEPFYNQEDVKNTLEALRGYSNNEIHKLDETLSFQLIPSGHILGAYQILLYITDEHGKTNKILYTSDLGNVKSKQYFVKDFQAVQKADVVIGESTYGNPNRKSVSKCDRKKDIEKLRTVIEQTCIQNRGKVIIPVFSLQRSQTMLRIIYEIFGKDEYFNIPVILDSPLAVNLTNVFMNNLDNGEKEKLREVLEWKNLRLVTEHAESKRYCDSKKPMIVLSSSGMASAGRVKFYLQKALASHKNTIVFCGFSAEGSLSWKIKNLDKQKTIRISGKQIKNKANVVNLVSFTSHMQFDDLIKYYSSIHCERIYLVHGNMETKLELKYALENKNRDMGNTTKIVCVNKGVKATI